MRTPRKVCVVTTSRADFGSLRWLMREIRSDASLRLQVVVSGMHLDPSHGGTVAEVEAAGFRIDRRVAMLLVGDEPVAVTKSIGVGLISFGDALSSLAPDLLVLLGDRFEILAPAIAAFVQRIPIAHIHGGETTEGALDEGVRHAVTKLATWHFPATSVYGHRIVQLGEPPSRVFVCGAPGLDAIHRLRLLSRRALARTLGFDLRGPVALVTYHPVTLEPGQARRQVRHVLQALNDVGIRAVVTAANADVEGAAINQEIARFCASRPDRFHRMDNLGQLRYLSCLSALDVVVGNSSSGLVEAPSFGIPVVNVGSRQQGRVRAPNVIDAANDRRAIGVAIRRALNPAFRRGLTHVVNPYDPVGDGRNSRRIKDHLKRVPLSVDILKKPFGDIRFEEDQ
jgi:UDP-hydrolysing UDP-N-acetyl-D-glucosamine 2-epimerase